MPHRILRIIERCLLVTGAGCLAVYGAARLHAHVSQVRAAAALDEEVRLAFAHRLAVAERRAVAERECRTLPEVPGAATAPSGPVCPSSVTAPDAARPEGVTLVTTGTPDMTSWDDARRVLHSQAIEQITPDQVLGRLEIPSIHVSVMVLPGVDALSLNGGVGLIPGTAMPGAAGNVCLAGHRDGFFRELGHVAAGDTMTLVTPRGTFEYRVDWTRIVYPEDVQVLAATPVDAITLVTCYPFRMIGHSPQRFIVRATCAASRS